jgi:hypothetical protein
MRTALSPAARPLVLAGATLVGCSLVGGVVSIEAGVNSWSDAWTAEATLAAPWPMLLVQAGATVASARPRRRLAAGGAVVLGLSAAVAGISGFFDGQLGRADLTVGYVTMQYVYVVVAAVTVVLAASRLRGLMHGRAATVR